MQLWTEIEFERIAMSTKISDRTRAACREVLVEGATGKDAAERHGVLPPQISRALGILRSRREEVMTPSDKHEYEAKKENAMRFAQQLLGEAVKIEEPKPGQTYSGPVVVNTDGFVVQKVGRKAVIHELSRLQNLAKVTGDVEVKYPKTGIESAQVKSNAVEQGSKGRGR